MGKIIVRAFNNNMTIIQFLITISRPKSKNIPVCGVFLFDDTSKRRNLRGCRFLLVFDIVLRNELYWSLSRVLYTLVPRWDHHHIAFYIQCLGTFPSSIHPPCTRCYCIPRQPLTPCCDKTIELNVPAPASASDTLHTI